jgi:UDP-glucose 4-epimerase
MIEILKKNKRYKFNIFNIASGKSYSVRSVVNALIKISKTNKKVTYQAKRDNDIHKIDKDHYSDINKVKKIYEWQPEMKINKGLRLFYEF